MTESSNSGERPRRIVVLSGAGISAESGLQTFRGNDGLWEGQSVYKVATPEAWERDPEAVLRFYNFRRQQVRNAQPNAAHLALARLQEHHLVQIITQNIDDLHERAGARNVLHLHGEIMKAQSSRDPQTVIELGERDIEMGDLCPRGSQLRPHVVWFGEPVTTITKAAELVSRADVLLVVGTSLSVYPAAGLVDLVPPGSEVIAVNPDTTAGSRNTRFRIIGKTACDAVPGLVEEWIAGA